MNPISRAINSLRTAWLETGFSSYLEKNKFDKAAAMLASKEGQWKRFTVDNDSPFIYAMNLSDDKPIQFMRAINKLPYAKSFYTW